MNYSPKKSFGAIAFGYHLVIESVNLGIDANELQATFCYITLQLTFFRLQARVINRGNNLSFFDRLISFDEDALDRSFGSRLNDS
jgi:hypothetical protein